MVTVWHGMVRHQWFWDGENGGTYGRHKFLDWHYMNRHEFMRKVLGRTAVAAYDYLHGELACGDITPFASNYYCKY